MEKESKVARDKRINDALIKIDKLEKENAELKKTIIAYEESVNSD